MRPFSHLKTAFLTLTIFVFAVSVLASTEPQVIISEATYTMGDGETLSFAEAQVLQRAKQLALEQAGTYVESYTKVQNLDLTTDEIQTIAGGVMTIEVLDKSRALVGDGVRLYIKIKATVTTDNMEELAQRIKGKNVATEYKKLQEEYTRLSCEVETLKQLAEKSPVGKEREAALDQIREREQAFVRTQQNEVALFQRLVSGQALVAEAHDDMAVIDRLIESIKRDGFILEIGKVRAFSSKDFQDQLTLTVPIRLRTSTLLKTWLSGTAQSLGGHGLQELQKHTTDFGMVRLWHGSFDNVPSRFYRVGYGDVREVEISNTVSGQEYFRKRVRGLVLVAALMYDDPGMAITSCRVPFFVYRLISGQSYEGRFGPLSNSFDIDHWRTLKVPSRNFVVLLVTDPAGVDLEFDLPSGIAKRVERVSTWWVDSHGAPDEICRIVPDR